jgi:antibiotic biosynthesis monooxygenase
VISVTHFAVLGEQSGDLGEQSGDFAERARTALAVLAQRPGFLRGSLGRSTDEPGEWVLITEWENVGSYRRALGAFEVKLHAAPLLGEALDLPSSFEPLLEVAPGGAALTRASDRDPGADA